MTQAVAEQHPVDLRCPADRENPEGECHPGKLLARLRLTDARPSYVQPDNLLELDCPACKQRLRAAGRRVRRVLHRFNFAGQLVESAVVEDDRDGREGC